MLTDKMYQLMHFIALICETADRFPPIDNKRVVHNETFLNSSIPSGLSSINGWLYYISLVPHVTEWETIPTLLDHQWKTDICCPMANTTDSIWQFDKRSNTQSTGDFDPSVLTCFKDTRFYAVNSCQLPRAYIHILGVKRQVEPSPETMQSNHTHVSENINVWSNNLVDFRCFSPKLFTQYLQNISYNNHCWLLYPFGRLLQLLAIIISITIWSLPSAPVPLVFGCWFAWTFTVKGQLKESLAKILVSSTQ